MAEKYGTVPDKFTREWWGYFWMYYKWHTIITVIALIVIAVTVTQCVTKEKFDLTVNYMGQTMYSQEYLDKAEEVYNGYALDADGNGEVNVFFQQMNIADTPGSEEMNYAIQTKHDMELGNDGSFIFIYDENEAANQLNREQTAEIYADVREWADMDIEDDRLIKTKEGTPVAVKLTGDNILSQTGINTEGLVICIRQNYSDKEYNKLSQQGAIQLANELIK